MVNPNIERILAKAEQRRALSREEIALLLKNGSDAPESLFRVARELRNRHFQNEIFLYGFVYFSTWCHNDCAFCYYRQSNPRSPRYRKSDSEILEAAGSLTDSGVHLIDLTSGEDSYYLTQPEGQEMLAELARAVKMQSGLPVMVSPGVVTDEVLRQLAAVGADWYACYQETYNRELFQRLRLNQSFDRRLQAKQMARKHGLLVEEGILRGAGETLDDLAVALVSMQEIGAQQVRVKPKKRYYRKRVDFFRLVEKIKLWPSRTGLLHGVKTFVEKGSYAELTTHCNKTFLVHNSKNSRAARWLRNKYAAGACKACRVPEWKLAKYSATLFNQHYGSDLETEESKNY